MEKNRKVYVTLFIGILLISCTSKKLEISLRSLDLIRGEIVLCGGDEFGAVSFNLSCNYDTKETFDLAISLLHSFEYYEAEKAFVKVLDADPNCAMAYWGVAMSILNHPKFGPSKNDYTKGKKILKLAEPLSKLPREKEYLDALGAYYSNDWSSTSHLERATKMVKPMEAMYVKYPDDKEAAIFYALSLFATSDSKDKDYVQQKKAGRILESIFPDQPDHPGIAHYIIHHYDHPELAQLALSTARRYADIAPGSAHAQHMPSHIFTRLGLWEESIESNLNSASSAVCYAGENEMNGHWYREIHALDYLIYAYLQQGDNEKAIKKYEYLLSINEVSPSTFSPFNFGAIPARIFLENRMWDKAAELSHHSSNITWEDFPWEMSTMQFARVLGAAKIGSIDSSEKELIILKSLHQELVKKEDVYRANQVLIQVKSGEAWIDFAKGNRKQALYFMEEAAKLEQETGKHVVTPGEVLPAAELLGDMLLAMNYPIEALKAYEVNLKRSPNRFNGIYGAAMAAERAGYKEKALKYYNDLLELAQGVNSDRIELVEANAFVLKNTI